MRRGLSAIELLVVVALMAFLAAGVLAALNVARTKARDVRRMGDIDGLQKVLSLYLVSNNRFPISIATTTLDGTDTVSTALLSDNAIQAIPLDPLSPTHTYQYSTNALGTTYQISFCLETDAIPNYSEGCNNTISSN